MAGILSLRKGDALQVRVEFTNQSDGSEYPMTGWTIEGDMRFANCTPVDLVGLVTLAATETTALVVGDYELQVRATSPAGNPTSTDPIIVRVRD